MITKHILYCGRLHLLPKRDKTHWFNDIPLQDPHISYDVLYMILKFRLIICQINIDIILSKNVKITESSPAVITFISNLANKIVNVITLKVV